MDLGGADFTAERCAEVAERAAAFVGKLAEIPELASPHLPAVQTAAFLRRLCGSGKVTHLLRTTRRRRGSTPLETSTPDPLSITQTAQSELPLRLGGRGGLQSQERVAPAAWVGSWAQCLAELALRSGVDSLEDPDASELPLAVACREAMAALPAPSPAY